MNQEKITLTANPVIPETVRNIPPFILWKEQLLQMGSALHALATTTESDFLAIGGNMTDFYQRACETTDMFASLIGIMSGDDITQTIDGLRDILALDSILAEFRLKVPGVDSKNRTQYLQHLESNYTMQSERKIHTSIMGSKPGHKAHEKTAPHIMSSPEAVKELGDNVELF